MSKDVEFVSTLAIDPDKKYLLFITVKDGYIWNEAGVQAIESEVKAKFGSLGYNSNNIATVVLEGAIPLKVAEVKTADSSITKVGNYGEWLNDQ